MGNKTTSKAIKINPKINPQDGLSMIKLKRIGPGPSWFKIGKFAVTVLLMKMVKGEEESILTSATVTIRTLAAGYGGMNADQFID